jgi:hypothetical protein
LFDAGRLFEGGLDDPWFAGSLEDHLPFAFAISLGPPVSSPHPPSPATYWRLDWDNHSLSTTLPNRYMPSDSSRTSKQKLINKKELQHFRQLTNSQHGYRPSDHDEQQGDAAGGNGKGKGKATAHGWTAANGDDGVDSQPNMGVES